MKAVCTTAPKNDIRIRESRREETVRETISLKTIRPAKFSKGHEVRNNDCNSDCIYGGGMILAIINLQRSNLKDRTYNRTKRDYLYFNQNYPTRHTNHGLELLKSPKHARSSSHDTNSGTHLRQKDDHTHDHRIGHR